MNGCAAQPEQHQTEPDRRRVVVVGVCASGKTTLITGLRACGYQARQCLQEHSHIPDMCYRLSRPDVVICLEASLETVAQRREIDYGLAYWEEQRSRLRYVTAHADLVIDTDQLRPQEVLERAVAFLRRTGPGSAVAEASAGEPGDGAVHRPDQFTGVETDWMPGLPSPENS